MAQKKDKTELENVEGSVQQSHDLTTGRAESEDYLASGNRGEGDAASENEAIVRRASKSSGHDSPRRRCQRPAATLLPRQKATLRPA